jgi:hypothetical protein
VGAVGGLLGVGGGANGTGFAGPSSANILNPTSVKQAQDAYSANQTALQQQQNLLQALQAQNGIQNQSNVYGQLQQIAAGQGPNPAQAMLNQATGQNVANQAALMAGQRGASQNAGLIARQAAQQGSQIQQAAAGQGATMQAQQSLGALGQLQNLATTQAGQQIGATGAVTSAQQAEQQALLNSIAQQNNANVGMQSNVNQANAGLAGQVMGGQQNLIGNVLGGVGSAFSLAEGGEVPRMAGGGFSPVSVDYNNNDDVFNGPTASGATDMSTVGPQSSPIAPPQAPALQPVGQPSKPAPKSSVGQFFQNMNNPSQPQGTGAAGQAIGKGLGQALKSIFNGSPSANSSQPGVSPSEARLQNDLLQHNAYSGAQQESPASNIEINQDMPMAAKGGKVPALVSPGERYLPPKEVKKVTKGEKSPMKAGEKIPGKPVVPGDKDDYANDIVRKNLEEGGIVLPRSVTQSKNPHWEAKKFVEAVMAKKRHRG